MAAAWIDLTCRMRRSRVFRFCFPRSVSRVGSLRGPHPSPTQEFASGLKRLLFLSLLWLGSASAAPQLTSSGTAGISMLDNAGQVWVTGWEIWGRCCGAVPASPAQVTGLPKVRKLSSTAWNWALIDTNGDLWTVGGNFSGTIGDGTTGSRSTPFKVLDNVVDVAMEYYSALAVRGDGTVWSWGTNQWGQLGDGTFVDHYKPAQIPGLKGIAQVASTGLFVLALGQDGTVWSWGDNCCGQIGDGEPGTSDSKSPRRYRTVPARVVGLSGIVAIAAGDWSFALALDSQGRVWGWGTNRDGVTGTTSAPQGQPAAISGLPKIVAISAHGNHALAIDVDGKVWAWGANDAGQLGADPALAWSATPRQVAGISNAVAVLAGSGRSSLALTADGKVWGWGDNHAGQLGDNTVTSRHQPQPMANVGGVGTFNLNVVVPSSNQPPVGNVIQTPVNSRSIYRTGTSITLDASGMTDPDGNIVSIVITRLSFSDSTVQSGSNPNLVLDQEGGMFISLLATDNAGAGALWFANISVAATSQINIPVTSTNAPGLASGPDGRLWFVDQTGNQIVRMTSTGGTTFFPIPTANSLPTFIIPGPDGAMWFTEVGASKIGRITTAGVVSEFALPASLGSPNQITNGPDGALWFTAPAANKVGRITTTGAVTEFALPRANSRPSGIATGSDGSLWITELDGNKIAQMTTTGIFTEYIVPSENNGSSMPTAIVAGPDGALWFTEYNTSKIGRITIDGEITEFAVTSGGKPQYIINGPDGNLWFTIGIGSAFARITPGGTITEYRTSSGDAAGITAAANGNIYVSIAKTSVIDYLPAGTSVSSLSSLTIVCPGTLAAGTKGSCSAIAGYTNNTSKSVSATYASSNSTALGVASDGTLTVGNVSTDTTVIISATYTEGGTAKIASQSVTARSTSSTLIDLSISGGSGQLAAGGSLTLSAQASYGNGSTKAVTATWSSSNATAAGVSASGQVSAGQVNSNTPVTITASYSEGGVTRTANLPLTIVAANLTKLSSLSIQGSSVVAEGDTATFKVIATYADGTSKAVAPTWTSSNSVLALVGSGGNLVTGSVNGDTQVTLTASYTESGTTVKANYVITVRDVPIALSYVVISGSAAVAPGQSTKLTATAFYNNNTSSTITPVWTSSNGAVASVSTAGVVTASANAGNTNVLVTANYSEGSVAKTALFSLAIRSAATVVINANPALAAGYSHTLALRNDGTVWSWGWSFLGQAGNGDSSTRSAPSPVQGLSGITAISAGTAHNLALASDGTVWSWGYNGQGGLGDGSTNDRYTPVQVAGVSGVKAVAAGLFHSLVLKADGAVVAWGSNASGQLGDGTNAPVRLTAVQVPGLSGVTAIAANLNASVALKADGTVWGWGDLGNQGFMYNPVQVGQLSGITSLAAGWGYFLALRSDGTVWAWGSNAQGQLGDGTRQDRTSPVQITGISGVKAIVAGINHSAALKSDGSVWIWGENSNGQHGSVTSTVQLTPQVVPGLSGAAALAVGSDYTIVLKSDGSVWASGNNWLGQLGDGSFVASGRFAPVQDADRAKFFDLVPEQVKAPVPASLVPAFFMKSEKSGDEKFEALGNLSSMSLASKIPIAGNGFAATYQMFVAIVVPRGKPGLTSAGAPTSPVNTETLFCKSEAAGWQLCGVDSVPAYRSNISGGGVGDIALSILENTNLSGMSGALFVVGYGTSASEMIEAGRFRVMYKVP